MNLGGAAAAAGDAVMLRILLTVLMCMCGRMLDAAVESLTVGFHTGSLRGVDWTSGLTVCSLITSA